MGTHAATCDRVVLVQDRVMRVKWNKNITSSRDLPGGGPQGGTLGILE